MDRVIYNAIMIAAARTGVFKEAYATWLIVSESTDPFVAADNESVNIVSPLQLAAHSSLFQLTTLPLRFSRRSLTPSVFTRPPTWPNISSDGSGTASSR